jgi:microcin C transport system substrate-binding protein
MLRTGPILAALLITFGLSIASTPGHAEDKVWRHAISLIGEPKYPADFAHFDYVNPNAPKGGTVRLSDTGGFDTLNPILPKGNPAPGIGLVYETLMTGSLDESSTSYGLIAEALSYPDDYSSVTFRLRPEAKWADGEPITPDDVVWSFNKLIELNPSQKYYYQHVSKAEVTGEREVTFTFDQSGNRELPSIVGQVIVLPKHWWEGKDANGKQRNIGSGTLEPPLGSGPYSVDRVVPSKTMVYKRNDDYWAKNLPIGIGQDNFDEVRYEVFFDLTVAFEGFKADVYDWWDENEAKRWATAYTFPAVQKGYVVKEEFENPYRDNGVMVGFTPNQRRPIFQDVRVRRALNYAFDFESIQRTIFYGQYERIDSFFYGTPLAAKGLPEGKELEILQSVKDKVPPEVFTTPYLNPVGGDPEHERANLREALKLLQEAGYKIDNGKMVDKNGAQLSFELLLVGEQIEPVALSYQSTLGKLGIDMRVRSVDQPQWINRVRSHDYDMIYVGWPETLSPGNEQRDFWGSQAADSESSRNYAGIKDPAVDALVEKLVLAKDRDELVTITHALDRVLMANHYVIPSYALRHARIARWDRFARPDPLPEFAIGFPTIWWWDEDKAKKISTGAAQ